MPDLNFNNPEVRRAVKDITKFWLDLGVDGFRLDAAKHIYGDTFGTLSEDEIRNDNGWWHEFELFVYGLNENAVIVGEVLGDRGLLLRLAWGLEGLLDEPFMNDLRNRAGWPNPGFLGRQKQFLLQARDENRKAFPPPCRSATSRSTRSTSSAATTGTRGWPRTSRTCNAAGCLTTSTRPSA